MGMCEACPNRAMMNLNKSLGNEDESRRIEQAGCKWWWGMEYEEIINGKLSGLKETRYECGINHLGAMLKDQGARVEEALQTANSHRNVISDGFENVVRAVIAGYSLPLERRQSISQPSQEEEEPEKSLFS